MGSPADWNSTYRTKSSVDEIRARFDADVERFSNLETGQSATVDAALAMGIIAESAAATTPDAKCVLDIGCGAGNYSLALLQHASNLAVTLIDLSQNMLDRAVERVQAATTGGVTSKRGDIREVNIGETECDIILAASIFHHLRADAEWRSVFEKCFRALRPGGSIWIFDLVDSPLVSVRTVMRRRYGDYLTALRDAAYRDHVFDYIEKEDSPRSLAFQLDLLRDVGFSHLDVLHKNSCFAAFGGMKS